MGLAKSIAVAVSVGVVVMMTAQAIASTSKGVQAFQRGKYDEALKFLEPEAAKGDPEALYALGRMYYAGQGVAKDPQKATDYFTRAAEAGNPGAQQSLGSALMLGEGVTQDMTEALKWFIISARAGNKDAAAYAGRVSRFMTRQQQREARMKAVDWQKAHDGKTADK